MLLSVLAHARLDNQIRYTRCNERIRSGADTGDPHGDPPIPFRLRSSSDVTRPAPNIVVRKHFAGRELVAKQTNKRIKQFKRLNHASVGSLVGRSLVVGLQWLCTGHWKITKLRIFQQRIRPGRRSSTSCRRVRNTSRNPPLSLKKKKKNQRNTFRTFPFLNLDRW